jgi:hypothetical protein
VGTIVNLESKSSKAWKTEPKFEEVAAFTAAAKPASMNAVAVASPRRLPVS